MKIKDIFTNIWDFILSVVFTIGIAIASLIITAIGMVVILFIMFVGIVIIVATPFVVVGGLFIMVVIAIFEKVFSK